MSKKPAKTVDYSEMKTGVPDFRGVRAASSDSYTTKEYYKPFQTRGRYIGAYEAFGASISDTDRLFYSTREPVGVWWVKRIAYDIWDNWFRLINPEDKTDTTLDDKTQRVLRQLKAHTQLPRETIFERRTGTGILLLSYTGFGSETDWATPLYTLNPDGTPPKRLESGKKLLQITPYPWTSVQTVEIEDDPASIRYGLPEYYTITQGGDTGDSTNPQGTQTIGVIRVHWTRVIHDAPRLDQHTYLGVPVIDEIFDDLVGARNARWAAYESYYRHGTGFPVIKMKGSAHEIREWVEDGGLDNFMHVRGYFICNPDEDFKFAGAEGEVLNPNTYFDMHFAFIAAGTGVAKDSVQSTSAGGAVGSEAKERQYFKSLSLQQNMKEPMLRELIDRLIQTGQINHDGEYLVEWIDPFEVNPQDKSAMKFMDARTTVLEMQYMTVNEIRGIKGLPPLDGYDIILGLPGQMTPIGSEPAPNQNEPKREEINPEEANKPESTLLDRVLNT